jgi:hypothetical protein
MGIKVYNKKNSQSAVCEREDWTKCRDHNPSKGWSLNTTNNNEFNIEDFNAEEAPSSVTVDSYNESSARDSVEADYEKYPGFFSEDYNTRAAALREKITDEIRTQGLGSNFKVLDMKDSGRKDNTVWVGICESCGEQVINRKDKGIWEHESSVSMGRPDFVASCTKEASRQVSSKAAAQGDTVIELDWAFKLKDKIKGKVTGNISFSADTKGTVKNLDRCNGFTAKGNRCTLEISPDYSNEYCHLHYKQGL